jgi:hypothetical protein
MPITSTAACHGPVPWTSRGRSGAGLGDTLDAVPAQAWPGRIVIAKPNLCAGGQRNVSHGGRGLSHGWELNRLGRAPLQIDPEEVPHPRWQVEGGNVSGHAQHTRGPSQDWGSQRLIKPGSATGRMPARVVDRGSIRRRRPPRDRGTRSSRRLPTPRR